MNFSLIYLYIAHVIYNQYLVNIKAVTSYLSVTNYCIEKCKTFSENQEG